ncbi:hypothetical protein [Psychrobacillus psychrodurans]|uniref:hypothetical protein n=1 Tax=Psychrobacillus psychrodurans TaxID=126157 RepID=UPI000B84A09C|nr:hypothetical protein [Psychrobacillus psychrodurans]MCZ8541862.1 hypothetical protein [Psychrobacillus psychrodurans]
MYDGHHIQVVNWFTGEKLCVNRQLQDENLGLAVRAKLNGEQKSSDNIQFIPTFDFKKRGNKK